MTSRLRRLAHIIPLLVVPWRSARLPSRPALEQTLPHALPTLPAAAMTDALGEEGRCGVCGCGLGWAGGETELVLVTHRR